MGIVAAEGLAVLYSRVAAGRAAGQITAILFRYARGTACVLSLEKPTNI